MRHSNQTHQPTNNDTILLYDSFRHSSFSLLCSVAVFHLLLSSSFRTYQSLFTFNCVFVFTTTLAHTISQTQALNSLIIRFLFIMAAVMPPQQPVIQGTSSVAGKTKNSIVKIAK